MLTTLFEYVHKRISESANSVATINKLIGALWIVVSDDERLIKVVFQPSGRLVVSTDGVISEGSYEPIISANSIIITVDGSSRLYNHVFSDEGMIFLRLDDPKSQPFVMVNSSMLGKLSAKEYLIHKYQNPARLNDMIKTEQLYQYIVLRPIGYEDIVILRSDVNKRKYAMCRNALLKEGSYGFRENGDVRLTIGSTGQVLELYREKSISIKGKGQLLIHCDIKHGIAIGCKVFLNNGVAPDGKYYTSWLSRIIVKNGRIHS